MRTVDPELWSKRVLKRRLELTRPMRFGRRTHSVLETCLRLSFTDALDEFISQCPVPAALTHVNGHTGSRARRYYVLFLVLVMCSGVCVVWLTGRRYAARAPFVVNLVSSHHSIKDIPFPAVGLCSTNAINNTALINYTLFLERKFHFHRFGRAEIVRNLLTFGALLTPALPPPPADSTFITFIEQQLGYKLNVTDLMFVLGPQCSSLLVRCSWAGRLVPCEELFAPRITSLGHCCVFNGRYLPQDQSTPPKILDVIGEDNGLSVVFRESAEEFAFLRRNVVGLEVVVFEGTDYPLLEGGGARLFPVKLNSTVYLQLSAKVQELGASLRYYSESSRGCRTRLPGGPRSASSYAWCLAECRRRAMLALCNCQHYTLPPAHQHCIPLHLKCLNKHKELFVSYYPAGSAGAGAGLGEEEGNGLNCAQCRPHCARRRYSAAARTIAHHPALPLLHNYFLKNVSLTNSAVVHIFYPRTNQKLFAVESNLYWYEMAGKLNSLWMCLVGVPLVSLVELVFHLTVRWTRHFMRRRRISRFKSQHGGIIII